RERSEQRGYDLRRGRLLVMRRRDAAMSEQNEGAVERAWTYLFERTDSVGEDLATAARAELADLIRCRDLLGKYYAMTKAEVARLDAEAELSDLRERERRLLSPDGLRAAAEALRAASVRDDVAMTWEQRAEACIRAALAGQPAQPEGREPSR